MASTYLFAVALLACFAAISAKSVINEDVLEIQLENLEWQTARSGDDVSSEMESRSAKKEKHRCGCDSDISCGCCLKPRIFGVKYRGCINMTMIPDDKKIEFTLNLLEHKVAQHNFSVAALDRICDRLPGKLSKLKFCLYTNTTESAEEGLVSCSSLDILFNKTPIVTMNFSCVQFKDNKLSFSQHVDVDRESMLNLKFKNPLGAIFG